jgi:hypothetical protein
VMILSHPLESAQISAYEECIKSTCFSLRTSPPSSRRLVDGKKLVVVGADKPKLRRWNFFGQNPRFRASSYKQFPGMPLTCICLTPVPVTTSDGPQIRQCTSNFGQSTTTSSIARVNINYGPTHRTSGNSHSTVQR